MKNKELNRQVILQEIRKKNQKYKNVEQGVTLLTIVLFSTLLCLVTLNFI